MENQIFFGDLYGYKNYNWKELTEDFINEWDYIWFWNDWEEIDVDAIIDERGWLKEILDYYEKQGTLITEIFLKQRIMRGTPLFEHLQKGGKVKLVMI
jgi:hypothetical protein